MNASSLLPEPPTRAKDVVLVVALIAFNCALVYLTSRQSPLVATYDVIFGLLAVIAFALLERVFPAAGPRRSRARWFLHFQILLTNAIASTLIFVSFGAALPSYISHLLGIHLGLIDLRLGSYGIVGVILSSTLLGVTLGDFFFYWLHRAMHKSQILWQHHKLHHMDPEFDVLTASRTNWVENVLYAFFYLTPPAILFKFDSDSVASAGVAYGALLFIVQMARLINHSSLRMQFGRASVIWISSQTHRIHHSSLPQHVDKNFSAFLPLWDILFGTYYHPRMDEFPPTGVPNEREIRSLWEVQIFALREWWKMFRDWRRRRDLAPGR